MTKNAKRLTQKKFFEALAARAKKYGFKKVQATNAPDLLIREKRTCCCPVVAVARHLGVRGIGTQNECGGAIAVGLDLGFADRVKVASDWDDGGEAALRRKLIRTVGIEEKDR